MSDPPMLTDWQQKQTNLFVSFYQGINFINLCLWHLFKVLRVFLIIFNMRFLSRRHFCQFKSLNSYSFVDF